MNKYKVKGRRYAHICFVEQLFRHREEHVEHSLTAKDNKQPYQWNPYYNFLDVPWQEVFHHGDSPLGWMWK